MRLVWATDIHLDFCTPTVRRAFYARLGEDDPDAVVLTGDIADAKSLEPMLLELAAAVAVPVYFVLGNHDFYGSGVAEVRAVARSLTAKDHRLRWLPATGVVPLSETTALVGHDGWADGRCGDWQGSRVMLNDYIHIADLARPKCGKDELLCRIQALAAEAAGYLAEVIPTAMATHPQVLVATHVPPFREACWHEGAISGDDWLPHFSSRVIGEVLAASAAANPGRTMTVLCGHTHGAGEAQIAPNLLVRTGGAEYREPAVQGVIEV